MRAKINTFLLLIASLSVPQTYTMLCIKKLHHTAHANITTRYCSDIKYLYRDIVDIGNWQCTHAYETNTTCTYDLCCKYAYRNNEVDQQINEVDQQIKDKFFDNLKSPVRFVDELKENINKLHIFDSYTKWRLLHSKDENAWPHYQKIFALINHKSECMLNQLRMIYQDAPPQWDERTYHHLGGMSRQTDILHDLMNINQYAKILTQKNMRKLLIEEIKKCKKSQNQSLTNEERAVKNLIMLSKVIDFKNKEVEAMRKKWKKDDLMNNKGTKE